MIEAFHKQHFSFFNCPREIEESCPCCTNREGGTEKIEITFASSEAKLIASLEWTGRVRSAKGKAMGVICLNVRCTSLRLLRVIYHKQQWWIFRRIAWERCRTRKVLWLFGIFLKCEFTFTQFFVWLKKNIHSHLKLIKGRYSVIMYLNDLNTEKHSGITILLSDHISLLASHRPWCGGEGGVIFLRTWLLSWHA